MWNRKKLSRDLVASASRRLSGDGDSLALRSRERLNGLQLRRTD